MEISIVMFVNGKKKRMGNRNEDALKELEYRGMVFSKCVHGQVYFRVNNHIIERYNYRSLERLRKYQEQEIRLSLKECFFACLDGGYHINDAYIKLAFRAVKLKRSVVFSTAWPKDMCYIPLNEAYKIVGEYLEELKDNRDRINKEFAGLKKERDKVRKEISDIQKNMRRRKK